MTNEASTSDIMTTEDLVIRKRRFESKITLTKREAKLLKGINRILASKSK